MNIKHYIIIILSTLLISCGGGGGGSSTGSSSGGGSTGGGDTGGGDSGGDSGDTQAQVASGISQKGPFIQGTTITAYKLNTNGTRDISNFVNTTTTDNLGTFNFDNISWTGATEFVASGNYFNENNASTTNSTQLSAIVDVTTSSNITVNINAFTHLEAQRIKTLMASNINITTAKTNAYNLIKNTFGLTSNTPLTQLNLTTSTTNNADNLELLKTSAAIAKNQSLLNSLSSAIQDGDISDNISAMEQLKQNLPTPNELNNIRDNLKTLDGGMQLPTDTNTNKPPVLAPIINQTKTYGDDSFQITLNAVDLDDDIITFSQTQSNNNIANISISNNTLTITPQNAGTTNITITANDGNGGSSSKNFNLVINKKPITITANSLSKTINTNDPAFIYIITSGSLEQGDSITGGLSRESGESIGTYNITQGNLTAGNNYDINFITGILTINSKQIQQPLNIGSNQTKTYGDLSFTQQAIGGTGNGAITYQSSNENIATVNNNGEVTILNAGQTTITATKAGDVNYNAISDSYNLTINPKQLTITANNQSKTYGATDPTLTYTQTGLKQGDNITGNLSRQTGENSGTYNITQGTLSAGSNYNIGFNSANLTITPKPITITADNKTKTYDNSSNTDPELTYSITQGFLVGNDILSGTLTREVGQNAGSYDITQGTVNNANNQNYDISFNNATFTINRASQTSISINDITKNISDANFTPTYTGGNGLGDLVLTNSNNQSVATIINNQINIVGVGTSTINIYKEGDNNFENGDTISFILTIEDTSDNTLPIITLLGDNPQFIKLGDNYAELGATANDNIDGNITANIQVNISAVNTNVLGSYNVIYSVSDSSNNTTQQTRTVNVVNTIPLLLVRIEFNDFSFINSADVWGNKIFGTSEGQLNHYFNEVSGSKFQFTRANETQDTLNDGIITTLVNSNHIGNPSVLANTLSEVINNSVIPQIDSFIDFSQYDTNNDGGISNDELQFVFVLAGGEAATGWSQANGIWARAGCFNGSWRRIPIADSVRLIACSDNGWHSTVGERHGSSEADPNVRDATIGVIAHELGHSAFNLPDSYGVSGITGISRFSLMSTGTWARKPGDLYLGETPTHLSGWDKIEIGWMTPTIISNNGSYTANDINNNNNIFRINTNIIDEYFLIENRNNIGYDRGLNMLSGANGNFLGGLLISHIDENGADSYGHRIINIERANNSSLGHINNLFFAGNATTFDDNSTPNSRTKDGTSTGIRIINIGNQGESINFDVEGL